jgi:hypothetical protein
MKKIIMVLASVLWVSTLSAQNLYMTRSGQISFFSKTPMENIEAVNNEVTSMLNPATGEMVFAVLIKGFRFERALMEEHFNENYMESDKLPKASFQGKITDLTAIDFKRDGSYPVTVTGELTIHGVKQLVTAAGTVTVAKEKISVNSSFTVKPPDYKINIPSLVAEKIADTIEVKVNCQYLPKT